MLKYAKVLRSQEWSTVNRHSHVGNKEMVFRLALQSLAHKSCVFSFTPPLSSPEGSVLHGILTFFEHFRGRTHRETRVSSVFKCIIFLLLSHQAGEFIKVSILYMPAEHWHTRMKSCNLGSNPISTITFILGL